MKPPLRPNRDTPGVPTATLRCARVPFGALEFLPSPGGEGGTAGVPVPRAAQPLLPVRINTMAGSRATPGCAPYHPGDLHRRDVETPGALLAPAPGRDFDRTPLNPLFPLTGASYVCIVALEGWARSLRAVCMASKKASPRAVSAALGTSYTNKKSPFTRLPDQKMLKRRSIRGCV